MDDAAIKKSGRLTLAGPLLVLAGFALAWAVCACLPQIYFAESFPVYRRQQLPMYSIFDPARAAEPKHAFVGSSYIINAWVANDLSLPGWPEIEDPDSSYAATADLSARREFGAPGQGFYDMGRPGPGFLDHIWYIEHALRAKNLKTIIYSNGYSGMTHFEPNPWADVERACLEALYVLDGWKKRFPGARGSIERYETLIRQSDAYSRALERFGKKWRENIDGRSIILHDDPYHYILSVLRGSRTDAQGMSFRGNPHLAVNKPAEMRDVAVWSFSWLAKLGREGRENRTLELLDRAESFYRDSRLDAPVRLNPPTDPFAGPEAEADRVWTTMIGEVLREAGVRWVWFFPPEVSVLPQIYRTYYKPGVVDTVASIIEPMGHVVSDHVVRHDLNQRDFLVQQFTDPPFGYGYKPTSIGKLKAVRLLLADMVRAGALPGKPWNGVSCWDGERGLPKVAFCIRPYPPLEPDRCLPWKVEENHR